MLITSYRVDLGPKLQTFSNEIALSIVSALKEEKKKKIDEEPNASFSSLASVVAKKCIEDTYHIARTNVISVFQPFYRELFFLLKLNEEAISGRETDALPQTLALMEEECLLSL
ncbi:hypothetical protein YC2023_012580 [Brassica napus]